MVSNVMTQNDPMKGLLRMIATIPSCPTVVSRPYLGVSPKNQGFKDLFRPKFVQELK